MLERLALARDQQLETWPLAKNNYEALGRVRRRGFILGPIKCFAQLNPARSVSTGAKTDNTSIASRPCFLCEENRPAQQIGEEILPGWTFLINPYPIFPLHFTIVKNTHVPQGEVPFEMALMAERLPGMTVFFNGARAGASAPDHMHCQAVPTFELPLMKYLEDGGDIRKLPYEVDYRIITPDGEGQSLLAGIREVKGTDPDTGLPSSDFINAFMWIGSDGVLRSTLIPRRSHRPSCYDSSGGKGFMISPGAIDMAGIMVVPRESDFGRLSQADVELIYSEVTIPNLAD